MDGCHVIPDQIVDDQTIHFYIDSIANYTYHRRITLFPARMKWDSAKEKAWDLYLDSDAHYNINWWHLLTNNFDSVGVACNCNTEFSEICIIELGKNVVSLLPLEKNNMREEWVEPWWNLDQMWIRDWSSWDIDECKQEMPDYYYCINDQ